jgi:valyl-tRNA synthetase
MSIPKIYLASKIEEKWYNHWLKKGYFHSEPDKRIPYTIVIPPPNVTGVLHMGHMLNNTIQDVIIRKARMQGFNTCWVPGTDHASIATEAKVLKKLSDEGINKNNISREEFMVHAYAWKEKHGGIILEQLKKLGASCDWDRTKFTMDKDMNESVIKVFIDLFNKGLIYRGVRMVNWDPSAQTAISDEEVIHKEVNSKLYHISYNIKGSDEKITIATTRPETILGDTAICVNPLDKRYTHLKNKSAIVPLINREIPIIYDEYVDIEFGTGALKVTPAHDINDYNLGDKHNLETIDILNNDGTLNENAKLYVGIDRFKVREDIVVELANKGFLIDSEDITNKVGYSERTQAVIEPKLSMQWFCKMEELSKPALDHVMNDDIRLHPAKFKNTYRHWMENIKDWCVSRQLWWGQQIPAYFYEGNKYVVAENIDLALSLAQKENPSLKKSDLRQDEDVLDTWFSSWLWPISVFDGIRNPENKEIQYYYPTNDLVTGPDILFFWVARMIVAGYEFKKELPFKDVYLTGLVRDKQGRKMSKSLGNSPDPLELIEKYGADGVRVGMLLCAPAGNDLPFDENLCEQGRNFSNKIWNAFRLIKGWEVSNIPQEDASKDAIKWFENKRDQTIKNINQAFSKYRISEALMFTYKLVWDDFCSLYLEIIKPEYQQPIDRKTYESTIKFLDDILKLLHPFMPFLSEELWHQIKDREEDIIISSWPKNKDIDEQLINDFENTIEIVSGVRNIRKQKNIAKKEKLELLIIEKIESKNNLQSIIIKLGHLSSIKHTDTKVESAFSFMVKSNQYFIPLLDNFDKESELDKLHKDLEYTKGFHKIVEGKLSNEKFVNNAPEQLVQNEQNKLKDAKEKIRILTEKINSLS